MKQTKRSSKWLALLAAVSAAGLLSATAKTPATIPGFGPLQPTASENTGEVLLELPPGFKYNVLIKAGDIMSDGNQSPGNADGMGAFACEYGLVRLVRNHELNPGTLLGNPALAYDPAGGGGTTTLTVDLRTRKLVDSFISLGGTVRNCAGGITPWGTWITCEETTAYNAGLDIQHGYNFEVDAYSDGQVDANAARRPALGLLFPEAAAVDPATGIVYITMDLGPGGFFRFVPDTYGDLSSGQLQMLAIEGKPMFDANNSEVNVRMPVTWVDINTAGDEAAYRANRLNAYLEGLAQGGTTFDRPEGCWAGRNAVFFSCTDDGPIDSGQIYELYLKNNDVQELTLIYTTEDQAVLDSPDNICVTPGGNNLILCEDGSNGEYLHLLRRSGNQIYRLAKNVVPGFEGSEWAGACFSPDGSTLFANLQSPSMTFAIWTDHWGSINK